MLKRIKIFLTEKTKNFKKPLKFLEEISIVKTTGKILVVFIVGIKFFTSVQQPPSPMSPGSPAFYSCLYRIDNKPKVGSGTKLKRIENTKTQDFLKTRSHSYLDDINYFALLEKDRKFEEKREKTALLFAVTVQDFLFKIDQKIIKNLEKERAIAAVERQDAEQQAALQAVRRVERLMQNAERRRRNTERRLALEAAERAGRPNDRQFILEFERAHREREDAKRFGG